MTIRGTQNLKEKEIELETVAKEIVRKLAKKKK
jgi:hypothetical protein